MVRQLKHHEQKLLKKVDFLNVRRPLRLTPPALSPSSVFPLLLARRRSPVPCISRSAVRAGGIVEARRELA
jgi:hypothetical protein